MKVKTLLLSAFAVMSLSAVAQTQFTGCHDVVTGVPEKATLKPGETTNIAMTITPEKEGLDFTNMQFDIVFPEAFEPAINEDEEDYIWAGEDITTTKKGLPYVDFSTHNMKNPEKYPRFTTVGSNGTKTAQSFPSQFATFCVKVKDNAASGEYAFKMPYMKFTCFNNDSYKTEDDQVLCVIKVEAESSAVNDLNVNTVKTYKTIENGQVMIVKGNVKYNTMGQIVK